MEAAVRELENARGDRDPALALHLHPVGNRARATTLGLHRAGELDRASVQEKLFGKRRLAGVGVGDDGKGSPLLNLLR